MRDDFLGPLREERIPVEVVAAVRRRVSERIRRRTVPVWAVAVAASVAVLWMLVPSPERVPLPEPVVAAMPEPVVAPMRVQAATAGGRRTGGRRTGVGPSGRGLGLRVTAVRPGAVEMRGSLPHVLFVLVDDGPDVDRENERKEEDQEKRQNEDNSENRDAGADGGNQLRTTGE